MNKIFELMSPFAKNTLVIVLIFCSIGMLVPSPAYAARLALCGQGAGIIANIFSLGTATLAKKTLCFLFHIPLMIAIWASDFITKMVYYIADAIQVVTNAIITRILDNRCDKFAITKAVTRVAPPACPGPATATIGGAVFLQVWATMRDLANMVVVVMLIIIALATILNLEKYRAQKLLVGLIVVALLINFSVVFVGFMIDLANMVMRTFSTSLNIVGKIWGAWRNMMENWLITDADNRFAYAEGLTYLAYNYLFVMMFLLVSASYIYFTIMFVERFAFLGVLFIFSPLAFAFYAFPPTRNLTEKWWKAFLDWLFKGFIGLFAIYLAGRILSTSAAVDAAIRGTDGGDFWTRVTNMFFYLLLILVFLLIGYKAAKKSSWLAQKVVEAYQKVQAIAIQVGLAIATGGASAAASGASFGEVMGAAGKSGLQAGIGAMQGQKLGSEQAAGALKSLGAQAAESMGVPGTRGLGEKYSKKAKKKLVEQGEAQLEEIEDAETLSHYATKGTTAQRAAAVKKLAKKGALSSIPEKERKRAIEMAVAAGGDDVAGEVVKANADYAPLHQAKMQELRTLHPKQKGETPEEYKARIERMAKKSAQASVDDSKLNRMNDSDLSSMFDKYGKNEDDEVNSIGASIMAIMAKRGSLKKLGLQAKDLAKHAHEAETNYGETVRKQAIDEVPEVAAHLPSQDVLNRAEEIKKLKRDPSGTGSWISDDDALEEAKASVQAQKEDELAAAGGVSATDLSTMRRLARVRKERGTAGMDPAQLALLGQYTDIQEEATETLEQESVNKVVSRMSAEAIGKLPGNAIKSPRTRRALSNLDDKKLAQVVSRGSAEATEAIAEVMFEDIARSIEEGMDPAELAERVAGRLRTLPRPNLEGAVDAQTATALPHLQRLNAPAGDPYGDALRAHRGTLDPVRNREEIAAIDELLSHL